MADLPDWDVTEAMIRQGGSFVQGLGSLYRKADGTNQAKLKAAFPEYWTKYAEIARSRQRRGEGSDASKATD